MIIWVVEIFLYSSSVYSCHLILISSAFVRSIPFLSFIELIFAWHSLGISTFLEVIANLSHSIAFLYFLHWSLRKTFLSLLAILWNSAFKWVILSFSPLLLIDSFFPSLNTWSILLCCLLYLLICIISSYKSAIFYILDPLLDIFLFISCFEQFDYYVLWCSFLHISYAWDLWSFGFIAFIKSSI